MIHHRARLTKAPYLALQMLNTRDVAFGASKAFIWDAARVNLPGGKKS
jgi:hypothetical protein